MNEFVSFAIALGPYIVGALFLGLLLAGTARWFINQPQQWLFFAILLFSIPAFVTGGDGVEGSVFKQLSWGGVFAFSAIAALGVIKGRLLWPRGEIPMSLLLLAAFVICSVFWSPNILVSFKRATQVVGVLFVALLIGQLGMAGKGLREQLLMPSVVFVLLGLAVAVAAPSMSFDQDHALRAFSSHKNTWGQVALLASLVTLFSLMANPRYRWFLAGLLTLSVASLALSRSTTSILAFLCVLVLVALILLLYRSGISGKLLVVALGVISLVGLLVFIVFTGELPFSLLLDSIFRVTEKNQTLTGRMFLWQLMGAEIERHPWLGIGYGGFWMGLEGPSAAVIKRLSWGPPSQAHSGYIDVVNEIGIFGAFLLGVAVLAHAHRIFRLSRSGAFYDASFHAAVLITVLISNYAETSLLRTTHIWWVVFCASIFEVHMKVRRLGVLEYQQHFKRLAANGQ